MHYLRMGTVAFLLGALGLMGGCGGGNPSPSLSPTEDYIPVGPFGPYREILGPGGPEKASIFAGPTDLSGEISKRASMPLLALGDPAIDDIVDANGLQAYQLKIIPGKTWHVVKVWPRLADEQGIPDKGDPDLYVASVTQNFQVLGASLRWGKLVDFLAWQPNNTGNHVALVHGYGSNPAGYRIEYDLAPYVPVSTPEVPVTTSFYFRWQQKGNYWFSFEGLEGNNFFRIAFDYWDGKGWIPVDSFIWASIPLSMPGSIMRTPMGLSRREDSICASPPSPITTPPTSVITTRWIGMANGRVGTSCTFT